MKHKVDLSFFLILILMVFLCPQIYAVREQKQTLDSSLIFPMSDTISQFKNDPKVRLLYNKMVESIQRTETLYYEAECWSETILPEADKPSYSSEKYKTKYKIWMKKPNLVRMECFYTQMEKPYVTIIGDGDYFWTFWNDPSNDKFQNIYMREPSDKYSIAWSGLSATHLKLIIDPSLFYGLVYDTPKDYIEAIRKTDTEMVEDEECDVIEISSVKNSVSKHIWIAKADNLPRKLKEVTRDFHRYDRVIVQNELWANVIINKDISMDTFVWKPPVSWQRINRVMLYSLYSDLSSDFRMIPTIEPINLSGKWKYTMDNDPVYADVDYNDENWKTMDVPYAMPSLKSEKCIWFRKTFFIPEYYKEQKYMLRLGTFPASASLYFNGELVGEAEKDEPLLSSKLINVLSGKNNLISIKTEFNNNKELNWFGEPIFKPLSGWIEKTHFKEEDFTMQHYLIYVPQSYSPDKAFPLIAAMAGGYGGRHVFNVSKITKYVESNGYIMICPGITWQGQEYIMKIGSIESETLSNLSMTKNEYNIDPDRVYIMGQSNGGFSSYYMGFRNSTLFAAIASISGSIGGTKVEILPRIANMAKEHIPVYIIHGAKDIMIPITRANYMAFELKRLGYEYELYVYPEGDHSILGKEDVIQRVIAFFDKYPKQKPSEAWGKLTHKKIGKLSSREEKLIKNVIKTYAEGYNKKDIKQIMSCFSKEYYADGMTYPDVRNNTIKSYIDSKFVYIDIRDIKIILNTDDVSIIGVILYIMKHGDKSETNEKLWLRFIKEDKTWKICGGNLILKE